jgi:hypothetical protein
LGFLCFFVDLLLKNLYNMKVDHFYWRADVEIIPKSKILNQINFFGSHFSPLFKKKTLPPYNNCVIMFM